MNRDPHSLAGTLPGGVARERESIGEVSNPNVH